MAGELDRLSVVLEAETRPLRQGFERVEQKLEQFDRKYKRSFQRNAAVTQSFQRSIMRMGGALAAVAAPAVLGAFIQRSLAAAESIQDLSDRAGVSAEFLQEMRYAASQSGAEARDFDDAISRLNRRLGLFQQYLATGTGEAGPAANAFRSLGLETRIASGELSNAEEVFREAVRLIGDMESTSQRAALASQLFGEDSGPRLQSLLARGTEGIRTLTDQARELGIVLDNEMIRKGAEASDRLETLGLIIQTRLTAAVVENAEQIDEMLQAFIQALPTMIRMAEQLANMFLSVNEAISGAADNLFGVSGIGGTPSEQRSEAMRGFLSEIERRRTEGERVTPQSLEAIARGQGFSAIQSRSFRDMIPAEQLQGRNLTIGGIGNELREINDEFLDLLLRGWQATLANEATRISTGSGGPAPIPSLGNGSGGGGNLGSPREAAAALPPPVRLDGRSEYAGADGTFFDDGPRRPITVEWMADPEADAFAEEFKSRMEWGIEAAFRAASNGNLLSFFARNLRDAVFQGAAQGLAEALTQSGIGGTAGSVLRGLFTGSFGGGKRAAGGAFGGRAMLVGESGPEIVATGAAGTVINAAATRALAGRMTSPRSAPVVQQHLHLDARGAVMTQDLLREMERKANDSAARMGRTVFEATQEQMAMNERDQMRTLGLP